MKPLLGRTLTAADDQLGGAHVVVTSYGFWKKYLGHNSNVIGDLTRCFLKAPANEVINLAVGLETILDDTQQRILNPLGTNTLRFFHGRGYLVWGARTITSDSEWKHVAIRGYLAYLEDSIDNGTQWVVFEPNGEPLWANVRQTISVFLTS